MPAMNASAQGGTVWSIRNLLVAAVSLLARAIENAGLQAPVTSALARLIDGTLPLDDWVELVRTKQPAAARFRRPRTWWARVRARWRRRGRR